MLIDVPEELDVSHLRGKGLQPGEQLLPDDDGEDDLVPSLQWAKCLVLCLVCLWFAAVVIDEGMVSQLAGMGFDLEGCKKAVYFTHNQGTVTLACQKFCVGGVVLCVLCLCCVCYVCVVYLCCVCYVCVVVLCVFSFLVFFMCWVQEGSTWLCLYFPHLYLCGVCVCVCVCVCRCGSCHELGPGAHGR